MLLSCRYKVLKETEASGRGEWSKSKKGGGGGVSLLEDINSQKRTWSFAVTFPTATIYRSPLPFFSSPALLSNHLLHSSGELFLRHTLILSPHNSARRLLNTCVNTIHLSALVRGVIAESQTSGACVPANISGKAELSKDDG